MKKEHPDFRHVGKNYQFEKEKSIIKSV